MAASNSSLVNHDVLVFPTKEEIEFFNKYAEIVDGADLIRTTSETLVMGPKKLVFKNIQDLPKTATLDKNIGRLFDIFIRKMIQTAGGDLENTCYWLNLRHLDGTDGYWIRHKTYKTANGHKLIKLIGKNKHNENSEIQKVGLDQTMILSMRIFKKDELHRTLATKVFYGTPSALRCDQRRSMHGDIIRKEMDETNKILSAVGLDSLMESGIDGSYGNISASGVFT
ncbi:hypothetical protein B9Z55_028588 [Caenorhabditis nigoni]|uniref:Uncharacterized protein n=1 Tax=Caenorhabditis nigoni TaxID=1611254 RepID=A0A2G5SB34_9PELO|nr:hypothetical protein B9Z55_028588 [Caenorhabditis nigoni]